MQCDAVWWGPGAEVFGMIVNVLQCVGVSHSALQCDALCYSLVGSGG